MGELLLIRHGQASFGAADYDRLSPRGEVQSQRLGAWLRETASAPALIASGTLRRHAQTLQHCVEAAGVDAARLTLPGLDELDHVELLQKHRPELAGHAALSIELKRSDDPQRAFQKIFADAVARWIGGAHDGDYARSWTDFRTQALAALQTLAERAADSDGEIWAFTSGGPIAAIVTELLGAPVERTFALSWPLVNTGLTRVRLGRRQHQLITYNAWPHLAGAAHADLVTHR
jgi:broad specificity phosphatase PhoE